CIHYIMSGMAERKQGDPGVRMLGQLAAATGLWLATYFYCTRRLATHVDGTVVRAAIAAIGIAGFLPWVFFTAKAIRMEDEFSRRTRYVSLAIAFAVTGVASFTLDYLHFAGFIAEWPVTNLWMVMVVIWWVAMLATARYYR